MIEQTEEEGGSVAVISLALGAWLFQRSVRLSYFFKLFLKYSNQLTFYRGLLLLHGHKLISPCLSCRKRNRWQARDNAVTDNVSGILLEYDGEFQSTDLC